MYLIAAALPRETSIRTLLSIKKGMAVPTGTIGAHHGGDTLPHNAPFEITLT